MKINKTIYGSLLGLVILISACSKNFEDINTSPDQVEEPTLDFLLPKIQLTLSDNAYYTNVTIIGQLMYQVSNHGTNFSTLTIGSNKEYHFEYQYATAIKSLVNFIDKTKESEELINYNSIGRILKAYAFHSITDLYGDIPYFNAGKGYIDRTFQPEYDDQKLVYEDMLNELKDAAEKFNPAQRLPGNTDLIYGGSIEKWQKMAYSLMLRLALRINKADPENSAKWISTAINGGLFESNADNFTVFYKPNTYYATISNGQPTPFIYYTSWKLAAPFVDYLKNNNDPRIYIYSALP
ncbi:MAG TPA: SusD/RagB family nutrient-binding outer membrane lipoprotein, partial [Flavitalea sp.]|nr:SusD/RagB family nutrient-binding outer membrane lipoprotein [Flavitalea sp.]